MRRVPYEWMLVAVQILATAALLGVPDVGLAWRYTSGADASAGAAMAAVVLLLWVGAGLAASALALSLARRIVQPMRRPGLAAGALVALGLVSLSAGMVRHEASHYSMCCGNLGEARQVAEEGR